MTTRPPLLVAVVGTATEVGKTWVAAHIARSARRRGIVVAARKPVQSHDPTEADSGRTDADVLAAATGESPTAVCPPEAWYPLAMAPPMAADQLARGHIAMSDLVAAIRWPDHVALGLVETVGGLRSPVAHDGDSLSLVDAVDPDHVVVVTDARLGTINTTSMTVDLLAARPVTVVVNRYDPDDVLHRLNLEWLASRLPGHATVTSDPDDLLDRMVSRRR